MPRAAQRTPSAVHVAVDNFMNSPRYDEVTDMVRRANSGSAAPEPEPEPTRAAAVGSATATTSAPAPADPVPSETAAPAAAAAAAADDSDEVLPLSSIVLAGTATDRIGAINEAGSPAGASATSMSGYVASMHDREKSVSTYMGNLLAIPHGTNAAKSRSCSRRSRSSATRTASTGTATRAVRGRRGRRRQRTPGLAGQDRRGVHRTRPGRRARAATSAKQSADPFGKVNS